MSKLFVMCGPPGCGKSTWAQDYELHNPLCKWVSRDVIRFSLLKDGDNYFDNEDLVYKTFCAQIAFWLERNYDVIADATHLNERARKLLLNSIPYNIDMTNVAIVYFKMPLDLVLKRNAQRCGRARVPDSVVKNMYRTQTNPAFDSIKYGEIINVVDEGHNYE